uniref:CCHC-type domain-containing protein n=1 Tax=Paramormyrops kingsleyae TaxID=1676925 RepID=A0A3B3SNE8_9TELE
MAALLGHIDAFDESTEQWSTYVERFEHFIEANDVVFLSVIGAITYRLLRSLLAPEKPGTKMYQDLVDILNAHFSPKPIIITERFRFHKRNQEEGESVVQYVAVLKRLSEHCDFGTHLQDAMRDRFVCGLRNESIQRKLLTEEALTFQRTVDIALSMEAVARESEHLKSSLMVHAVSFSPSQGSDKCFRCGRINHNERDCYYKDQQCHNCRTKGHIARMCKNKRSDRNYLKQKQVVKSSKKKFQDTTKGNIHKVEADTSDSEKEFTSDSDSKVTLHMVSTVTSDIEPVMTVNGDNAALAMMTKPKIEGQRIEMELDTGAAVSLMSRELYEAKSAHMPLRKTGVRGKVESMGENE